MDNKLTPWQAVLVALGCAGMLGAVFGFFCLGVMAFQRGSAYGCMWLFAWLMLGVGCAACGA